MPDKVKFALVGTGNMGRHNAQRVIIDGRGEIVAICDSNGEAAERAAAELGVADTFTEIDALIAGGDFDAAIVATPNVAHAPLSVALLDAGKHVYCEKPPASDVAGAKAVVAAADKAAGRFMFGFNQRFDPWAQHVKKMLDAGELGDIYHAQTQWLRRFFLSTFDTWFTDKELAGGGPLLDIGVHRLDQTLWLMGFPEVETVSGMNYDCLAKAETERTGKSYSVEEFSASLLRFANGASLILQASYLSYLPLGTSEMNTLLMGTKGGCLEADGVLRRMANHDGRSTDTVIARFDEPPVTPMGHFIDCVLDGSQPMCTAAQGLTVMKILSAIYESAAKRREVSV